MERGGGGKEKAHGAERSENYRARTARWAARCPFAYPPLRNLTIEKELKWELDAEIDRFKEMAEKSSRYPPSASRGRPGGADDPKGVEIIRFYEDLTNFLVCNMKMQKGKYLNLEEWILSCVYTYIGLDDDASSAGKSEFRSLVLFVRLQCVASKV